MSEEIGKQNSLHRPKPIEHRIEKQAFNVGVQWAGNVSLLKTEKAYTDLAEKWSRSPIH
jgi:hypothetical protein